MALFGKKEIKNYIVFDPYTEEAVAVCTTPEVKQILQVQPRAKFLECSQFEIYKYKEHRILPEDVKLRGLLEAKDIR
ncbi:MAG: hypothetical protein K2L07_08080 [Lachnospiraceae bacterium]|nr:hypothetical protein [Lachnospiraceae bacterium]